MTSRWNFLRNDHEEVRGLKNELWSVRRSIIELMDAETERLFSSYYSCKMRSETYGWERDVVEKIIEKAEVLQPVSVYSSPRAFCPLCRRGSSGPYDQGFSVPEGLSRHLTGWGNVHQCNVMSAVMQLAHDHWNGQFNESEQAQRIKEVDEKRKRLETEDVYLFDPFDKPVLMDDLPSYYTQRNENEMQWAIDRLNSLGFKIKTEGRTRSYVMETRDYAVYADPRRSGMISFIVVRQPLSKKVRKQDIWKLRKSFELRDSWKNDLKKKFDARLSEALELLK